jgi:hypothetical protein
MAQQWRSRFLLSKVVASASVVAVPMMQPSAMLTSPQAAKNNKQTSKQSLHLLLM